MGYPNLGRRFRLTPSYYMQRLLRKQPVEKPPAKAAAHHKPRIGRTSSGPRPEAVGLEVLRLELGYEILELA